MKRSIPTALGLVLIVATAGHSVRASDSGGGCGSDPAKPATAWQGSATCHFQFRGFPLIARGNATKNGTATVHVWISLTETSPPIVECRASGTNTASCQSGFPDSTTNIDVGQPLQTISCHVEGAATGHYWCQSASGR